MKENFKCDLFEAADAFTLEEANGEVDGKNIIGKIAGPFFVPNGKSRNKRFYPESLWKKTLSRKDVQEKLTSRQMLGTIGHDQALDDDAVREGKVSHIVTKLEMRDGQGFGEALILGTPSGQVLKTMVGAGVKMFVSSRATGGYKGEYQGMPIVDESKYQLKGFDFVLDPGFLEANPSLVESLKESMDKLINLNSNSKVNSGLEEGHMSGVDKELLEQVVRENGSIKKDLDDALTENESLKHRAASEKERADSLQEQLKTVSEKAKSVDEYAELGTPEEIGEALSVAKELLDQYKKHGTPEEIGTKVESLQSQVDEYEELGTPEEVDEAISVARERLAEYKDLGTPDEIETAFGMMREAVKSRKEERNESRAEKLAEELKIDVEKVKRLTESMDDDEIREFFKDVQTSTKATNRYKKSVNENKDGNEKEEGKERYFDKPVGRRLMESFGG